MSDVEVWHVVIELDDGSFVEEYALARYGMDAVRVVGDLVRTARGIVPGSGLLGVYRSSADKATAEMADRAVNAKFKPDGWPG